MIRSDVTGVGQWVCCIATLCIAALFSSDARAQTAEPELSFGIGWSMMNINDVEFTAISNFLVTEVLDHQSNEDGKLNGYKLNGELSGLLPHYRGSWLATLGFKGFYSRYEDQEQTRCVYTASTDCIYVPLIDPDPTISGTPSSSGGFFADWLTDVDRHVVYWGGAVEYRFSRDATQVQSLKDAPAPQAAPGPFQWLTGLSVRQLNQDMSLYSVDRGPTADPVTLTDEIDTSYYGGYVGFSSKKEIGYGLRLLLSGETGLYYARTDYNGAYSATASLGDDSPVSQSISLSDDAPAFIGLLHLLLERDFGRTTVGLFGEAEWLSYVPKVLYNDTDLNGGVPFDIIGSQDGTALGEGSAFSYTVGARLRIPTN